MFKSILFPTQVPPSPTAAPVPHPVVPQQPDFFRDLNLDQVFAPIFENEQAYHLEEFFYHPVSQANTILYRQSILKDLDNTDIFSLYDNFSRDIFKISSDIKSYAAESDQENRKNTSLISKGHMLFYAEQYVSLIKNLLINAQKCQIHAQGLLDFNDFLSNYITSEKFNNLMEETNKIRAVFNEKEYCLMIKRGTIKALKYNKEDDNYDEALKLFGPFIEDDSKDYLHKFSDRPNSEQIENKILTLLEKIYPKEFTLLNKFFNSNIDFVDDVIFQFAREIRFYIGWHNYIQSFYDWGLSFCYPEIICNDEVSPFKENPPSQDQFSSNSFDIALAKKLKGNIVVNDFILKNPERILVITGPNQGGKTTFARAFGQLFYLASLGLSVPGTKARLSIADKILTHFEREEKFSTQRGKLQDDVERLHNILSQATENSIIIINEIYASTTLKDALKLGNFMIEDIAKLKSIAVVVTFMDKLAEHGPETVSMMSNVKSENQNERTFKIIRRPPDGIAHALFIAEKYNLTYDQIKGRF